MTDPMIICPTHGRAGRITVTRVLPDIPLCVSESQAPLYADAHPNLDLVVHPDEIVGIAPKRQWLIDRYERVMMFDDDVTALVDMTVGPGEQTRITDPQHVRDLVAHLFHTGEQLGARIVGFSSLVTPAMFRPQEPFSFRLMVSGHCLGVIRDPRLRLPNMPRMLTDDLYVSALSMFHHRLTFTDQRYGMAVKDTWGATDGMASHRTLATMLANERTMREAFGDAVDRRHTTALSKIRNETQLTLRAQW